MATQIAPVLKSRGSRQNFQTALDVLLEDIRTAKVHARYERDRKTLEFMLAAFVDGEPMITRRDILLDTQDMLATATPSSKLHQLASQVQALFENSPAPRWN